MKKQPTNRPVPPAGYIVERNPKPVKGHDWDWRHEEYDGPEDDRCGTAGTRFEAVNEAYANAFSRARSKKDPRYLVDQKVSFWSEEGEDGLNHTGTLIDGEVVSTLDMAGDPSYGIVATSPPHTGRLFVRGPLEIYSSAPAPPAPEGTLYCCLIVNEDTNEHCGRIATWGVDQEGDPMYRTHLCDEHVVGEDESESERLPRPGFDWDQ